MPGDWTETYALFGVVDHETGEKFTGPALVRKVDGVKQYRRMSAEQEADWVSREAW